MVSLKNLILSLGITMSLAGCPNKPEIYEVLYVEDANLIHTENGYFFKEIE